MTEVPAFSWRLETCTVAVVVRLNPRRRTLDSPRNCRYFSARACVRVSSRPRTPGSCCACRGRRCGSDSAGVSWRRGGLCAGRSGVCTCKLRGPRSRYCTIWRKAAMPRRQGSDAGSARDAGVSRCQAPQPQCAARPAGAAQLPLWQGFGRWLPESAGAPRREQVEHAARVGGGKPARQSKQPPRRQESGPFPRRKPSSAPAWKGLATSTELLVYQRITAESLLL